MGKVAYRQCRLRKMIDGGHIEQTAFIPIQFAQSGKVVRIRQPGADWIDGWEVQEVFTVDSILRVGLPDIQAGIRQHRKRTGDSLPKERSE